MQAWWIVIIVFGMVIAALVVVVSLMAVGKIKVSSGEFTTVKGAVVPRTILHNMVHPHSKTASTKVPQRPPNGNLIFSDNFADGFLDRNRWKVEITHWGDGFNAFQSYTNANDCVTVKRGDQQGLYITPQFWDRSFPGWSKDNTTGVPSGGTSLDNYLGSALWGTASGDNCTGNQYRSQWLNGCGPYNGEGRKNIPFQSGRVTTDERFWYRYGRVEYTARLPVGDYLWPALWQWATSESFGQWPESAEIDVMESRGNASQAVQPNTFQSFSLAQNTHPGQTYAAGAQGNDWFGSTLHWGSSYKDDLWPYTHASIQEPTLTSKEWIYGLYWTSTELYTYLKDPVTGNERKVLDLSGVYGKVSLWDAARSKPNIPANIIAPTPDLTQPAVFDDQVTNAPYNAPMALVINMAIGGYVYAGTTKVSPYWSAFNPSWLHGAIPADTFLNDKSWYHTWGITTPSQKVPVGGPASFKIKDVNVWAVDETVWRYGAGPWYSARKDLVLDT